jgi:hypothetical protein
MTAVLELTEAPAATNELAPLAWTDLFDYLRDAAHRLNSDGSHDGLRLAPMDTLRLERMTRGLMTLDYFRSSGHGCRMEISFDRDLRSLRSTVDGVTHDLLAVSDGDAYGFRASDGAFVSVAAAGRSMLASILASKP